MSKNHTGIPLQNRLDGRPSYYPNQTKHFQTTIKNRNKPGGYQGGS